MGKMVLYRLSLVKLIPFFIKLAQGESKASPLEFWWDHGGVLRAIRECAGHKECGERFPQRKLHRDGTGRNSSWKWPYPGPSQWPGEKKPWDLKSLLKPHGKSWNPKHSSGWTPKFLLEDVEWNGLEGRFPTQSVPGFPTRSIPGFLTQSIPGFQTESIPGFHARLHHGFGWECGAGSHSYPWNVCGMSPADPKLNPWWFPLENPSSCIPRIPKSSLGSFPGLNPSGNGAGQNSRTHWWTGRRGQRSRPPARAAAPKSPRSPTSPDPAFSWEEPWWPGKNTGKNSRKRWVRIVKFLSPIFQSILRSNQGQN